MPPEFSSQSIELGLTNIALALGTRALTSFRVSRQNNTTNTTEEGVRIETGWGYIPVTTSTNTFTETVTFATPFSSSPIVILTSGGDSLAGTTYGSGGNTIEGVWVPKAITITSASFVAFARNAAQTNPGSNGNFFYQWIAIGS